MRILVTGGSGFIGSNLIRDLIKSTDHNIVNVDKLTYAGNPHSLTDVAGDARYTFEHADIADPAAMHRLFKTYSPDRVIHLAAESHVDRSIDGPADFIRTNVVGTFCLLEAATAHYRGLTERHRDAFRFLHVSTDEVYGSLGPTGTFSEATAYDPHSPYAASKAGSDHLARAWNVTYGLPILVTNCSNNYGPFQFPEKLIPLMIIKALQGDTMPVYGSGKNVRDWLYVGDHVRALRHVLERGVIGQTYNIGGNAERTNIDLVESLCDILDEMHPRPNERYRERIRFVRDRPGHDLRYAMSADKIGRDLGWRPETSLDDGLRKTVAWYLGHREWWESILAGNYNLQRLGRPDHHRSTKSS